MQFPGTWIDDNGTTQSGELWAWGEWEAESRLLCEFDQAGDRRLPARLWRPHYEPRTDYSELHNTDPFIFGERFIYSNCRQPRGSRRSGLMHIAPDSVIAFGSCLEREQEWVLDTVLVVRESVPYHAASMREDVADLRLEDAFMDVTGEPIMQNESADLPLRLYVGATLEEPLEGMFSFFPAMPAEEREPFRRPHVTLPSDYFRATQSRGPMGHALGGTDLSTATLFGLWESLVEQVRDAGLVLGTYAELPKRHGARGDPKRPGGPSAQVGGHATTPGSCGSANRRGANSRRC